MVNAMRHRMNLVWLNSISLQNGSGTFHVKITVVQIVEKKLKSFRTDLNHRSKALLRCCVPLVYFTDKLHRKAPRPAGCAGRDQETPQLHKYKFHVRKNDRNKN